MRDKPAHDFVLRGCPTSKESMPIMYRSPKEQSLLMPELQLVSGGLAEAAALQSSGMDDTEIRADFSSSSEQLKRTARKPFR
ncbi:hypothetical protein [Paenibacillus oleatilyticus]|uniref:Uncharacterized protein n=2 Tax=Paenibacillus TaxID=44249 RepID=A0ABV4V329_9BACL